MTAITLNLEPLIHLTSEQFYQLCEVNPDAKLERTASGELVVMAPTGGETGSRSRRLALFHDSRQSKIKVKRSKEG
ncbi:Uma2 family endonuclease, partial [Nostoc sp. CALU 1950]|uniref:Uma2 family endonuclease n=1 Tax=Nostoc sp. CALU 1950 TaxID=3104321 RepID=UPI003EBAC8A0